MNERNIFKGSTIFNFYFGFYLFVLWVSIYGTEGFLAFDRIILIILTALFAYLYLAGSLNFFIIGNDKFIVKNCWRFWQNREFEFRNIETLQFIAASFFGIGIKIITKDKRKRFYAANNLKRKTIEDLVIRVNEELDRGRK